jgi:membrane protein YdbS with pleckstrin-like domain
MSYPTKKDIWLVLIAVFGALLLIGGSINLVLTKGVGHPETRIFLAATIFYISIILLFAYPVYYEITFSHLIIRSGLLLKYKIPISSIVRVQPTRNPLSAPAWSLDRLRIDYLKNGKLRYVLISPENKETFLRDLMAVAPTLMKKTKERR